jgi:citrate synthase
LKKTDMTAKEAARALNVSVATLYAYVSRGLVRSEAAGGSQRDRRYRREDVERLRARQQQRRNPDRAAEQALSWGVPVLESSLTLIADGRLYYRGRDALALAQTATFEQVAELLWLGAEPGRGGSAAAATTEAMEAGRGLLRAHAAWLQMLPGATPIEIFQALLPLAARLDPAAYDLRPGAVAQTGGRILGLLTEAATYRAVTGAGRVAERLAQGWRRGPQKKPDTGRKAAQAVRLIEAALILCADHELNTSAFTARCVASVRGTPYQVVMAALAALQGWRHGGTSDRVEALFDEAGSADRAGAAIGAWLKRGEALPGFGHPLYPDGDPRASTLIDMAAEAAPRARELALARAVAQAAEALTGERPTIDFGLVVVRRALGLPRGAALGLFALGRTVGWIAHAMEQYQLEAMIRPRARYVGEAIGSSSASQSADLDSAS